MSSPRSLCAARQPHNTSPAESKRINGWPWSRRSMTERTSDASAFSFKSIFSPFPSSLANMNEPDEQTKEKPLPASQPQSSISPSPDYEEAPFRRFHYHKLSDPLTGSSESSPTTTISTVDDSSATDPSPGSSPESPPPSTFTVGMLRPRTSDDSKPFFELQKQPPPKKGRNLKNLAVVTSRGTGRATPSTSSLPLPGDQDIATITSPSFVKPPTPQKRKPSNLGLTLLTPGSSKIPPQEIKLAIPPTPAFGRPGTLRHFQSSPSLPLLPSILSIPQHPRIQPTLDTILSPATEEPHPAEEDEQNYELPLSKEEKPEAYPDGPICVYEPYIDLYLEPTAEQCRQYDVVMNVASEVRNPLVEQVLPEAEEPEIRIDGGGGIQFAPKRDRVVVQRDDGVPSQHDGSPTTPKAASQESTSASSGLADGRRDPEYIHIKWEHNSDIVPDLLRLVKLIDDKVSQKQRVLVHCQCGVSRSASLVVAYGLYKNPSLSVQEAYDAVKKRSKWIGPNMNLIMQLQEFRTSLHRGGRLAADRSLSPLTPGSAISEWGGPFSTRSPNPAAPLSAGVGPLSASQTAESLPVFTPGPTSAPSGFAWPLKDTPLQPPLPPPGQRARAISAIKPGSAYVNPSGRIVPILKIVEPDTAVSSISKAQDVSPDFSQDSDSTTPTELSSPRSAEFAMTPLQPSPDVDPADSFGLLSPSSTEFASSPFDRPTLLAQLGMGSMTPGDVPRRSVSLKSKQKPAQQAEEPNPTQSQRLPRLRGKISSPGIREQQQLQSLQAKIEASLPHRSAQAPTVNGIDEALMSPRATEFTQNPFALALSIPEVAAPDDTPRSTDSDPRSPAYKGVSPITRNILDVL